MNGPIQPWGDQNSHIPHKLFHSKKKLNKQKDQFVKKLRKTEWSFKTRTKTEYNQPSFRRVTNQSQQRIFTLDFCLDKQMSSNLRKVLCRQLRDQTISNSGRNNTKCIQIGSMKKKIIDLDVNSVNHIPVSKVIEKRLRSEPRIHNLKQQIQSKIISNDKSLLVKQAYLSPKLQRKAQDNLFFRTIANINKEKSKLVDSQISSFNEQLHQQRKMFLKKNRRFRSWQTLAKHNYSSNSTRQAIFY